MGVKCMGHVLVCPYYYYLATLDLSEAISQKRCKIGGKLLLITNRKSYINF